MTASPSSAGPAAAVSAAGYGAMPTTRGANFYEVLPGFSRLLERLFSKADLRIAEPHLRTLGLLASTVLEDLSAVANRNPPRLIGYDRRGERIDEIAFDTAYHDMERIGFGQFGIAAMPHRPGVLGWPGTVPQTVKYAFGYLFTHAEFGLMCPISVTDSTARMLRTYGSEEQQHRYLPGLTSTRLDELTRGTMWLTERNGGSDVGASTTSARQEGERWRLYGDKWFCSVADAEVILTLARPEGAPEGTRGLGMFLVPGHLPDGTHNHYRINRLKDKFGSRSMATGEVSFEGAIAEPVGPLNQGFRQMAEMINVSRLSNAMRGAAIMRRAFIESLIHARGRFAFGRPLVELPLLRQTLLEMLLDVEAAAALIFHSAALLDRADSGDIIAKRVLRITVPLAKFYLCKQARWTAGEAMEVRGGNGYVDDWPNARLLRDSYLGAIWEGSTNIVLLDIGRAILREDAGEALLEEILGRLSVHQLGTLGRAASLTAAEAGRVKLTLSAYSSKVGVERDLMLQRLAPRLAHLLAVSLLLDQAAHDSAAGHGNSTLLLAVQYARARLLRRDDVVVDAQVLAQFDALADGEPVPESVIASALAGEPATPR